ATLPYAARPFPLADPDQAPKELSLCPVFSQQFHHLPLGFAETNPEMKLMRAVLEDAIRCYAKRWSTQEKQSQRLAQEAEAWVFCEDLDWPLSFLNICTVLGIDPDYVRRGLRRWQQQPPAAYPRKQRTHGSRGRALKIAA
ncbi:MAG: hypothetical protein HY268_26130, partial [Deltaproteobacteria bacterium]|nr:hypothetical protein [Deltaproteobacteria bacterium]